MAERHKLLNGTALIPPVSSAAGSTVPPSTGRIVVSEDEAAEQLGLSGRTLQRLRLDGDGPPFVQLTGRRIGYVVADLHAWVDSRKVASTSARDAA